MENEFRELLNQNWSETFKLGGNPEFGVHPQQQPQPQQQRPSTSSAQDLNPEQYQPPCQQQTSPYPIESEQFINSVLSKVSNSISNYMSKVNNFVTTAGGGGATGQNEYTPSQDYLQKFNIYSGLVQQQQQLQQQHRNQDYMQESAFSNAPIATPSSAGCPNLIGIKDLKVKNALAQRQPNDAMIPLPSKAPSNTGNRCTNACSTYPTPHHQQTQSHFDGPTTSATSSSTASICKSALLIGNGNSGGSIVDSCIGGASGSCHIENKSNEIIDSTTPPPPTMHCTSSSASAVASSAPRPNAINFARAVSTGDLDKKMANSIRGIHSGLSSVYVAFVL